MPNIQKRLEHLEAHKRKRGRPLRVLLHLLLDGMTDRELTAVILECEPWEVERDLGNSELAALIAPTEAENDIEKSDPPLEKN